jgi:hypothetical protein
VDLPRSSQLDSCFDMGPFFSTQQQPGPTRTSDRIRSFRYLSSSSCAAPLPPGTLPHLPHIHVASPPPAPAAGRPHSVFVYGTLMVEEVVRVLSRASSSPTARGSASRAASIRPSCPSKANKSMERYASCSQSFTTVCESFQPAWTLESRGCGMVCCRPLCSIQVFKDLTDWELDVFDLFEDEVSLTVSAAFQPCLQKSRQAFSSTGSPLFAFSGFVGQTNYLPMRTYGPMPVILTSTVSGILR